MKLFGKKQEVLLNPGGKKKKREKEKKAPRAEEAAAPLEEDAYADLIPEGPEIEPAVTSEEKGKKKKPKEKKLPKSEAPWYRNRLVIGTACVVAASLLSFVLVPVMSYVTSAEMTTAVRLTAPVQKGKPVEASALRVEEVPAQGLAADVLQSLDGVAGKYAAVDLVPGDLLMGGKLTDKIPFPDDYLYSLPEGRQAISASIQSFAGGLSGKLLPGDVVSVYAVPNQRDQDDDDYHAVLPPELRYVRVLAVTNKLGGDKAQTDGEAPVMDEETQPSTVTLLVDAAQASALAGLEVNSKLHLALVTRGDEAAAQTCLATQDAYLETAAQSDEDELQALLDGMDLEGPPDVASGTTEPEEAGEPEESGAADNG